MHEDCRCVSIRQLDHSGPAVGVLLKPGRYGLFPTAPPPTCVSTPVLGSELVCALCGQRINFLQKPCDKARFSWGTPLTAYVSPADPNATQPFVDGHGDTASPTAAVASAVGSTSLPNGQATAGAAASRSAAGMLSRGMTPDEFFKQIKSIQP